MPSSILPSVRVLQSVRAMACAVVYKHPRREDQRQFQRDDSTCSSKLAACSSSRPVSSQWHSRSLPKAFGTSANSPQSPQRQLAPSPRLMLLRTVAASTVGSASVWPPAQQPRRRSPRSARIQTMSAAFRHRHRHPPARHQHPPARHQHPRAQQFPQRRRQKRRQRNSKR